MLNLEYGDGDKVPMLVCTRCTRQCFADYEKDLKNICRDKRVIEVSDKYVNILMHLLEADIKVKTCLEIKQYGLCGGNLDEVFLQFKEWFIEYINTYTIIFMRIYPTITFDEGTTLYTIRTRFLKFK